MALQDLIPMRAKDLSLNMKTKDFQDLTRFSSPSKIVALPTQLIRHFTEPASIQFGDEPRDLALKRWEPHHTTKLRPSEQIGPENRCFTWRVT